jgi:uncharacterized protein
MQADFHLVAQLTERVRNQFLNHGADHDFYHIERVVRLAQEIQQKEGGDWMVITCAALLHDISDHKLNGGIKNDNSRVAAIELSQLNAPEQLQHQVCAIVDAVSFKGAGVADITGNLELAIVRDADRLDAIGAIGIARALHYGGSRNRPFYVPNSPPIFHHDFDHYTQENAHTLNHFHEKLLLLKDRLQTTTAQEMAEKRHQLMLDFVTAFYAEWGDAFPELN